MRYMGSKDAIAEQLLKVMLPHRKGKQWVEPFVGGANMIDKVGGRRVGNDRNFFVIKLLTAIRDGYEPPVHKVNRTIYERGRKLIRRMTEPENYPFPKSLPPEFLGFMGVANGFGCEFYSTYCHNESRRVEEAEWEADAAQKKLGGGITGGGSDLVSSMSLTTARTLEKQRPLIQGVEFHHGWYDEFPFEDDAIIYCDPPYANTHSYQTQQKVKANEFNHLRFWGWVRGLVKKGHTVFISEYTAPPDFKTVLQIPHAKTFNRGERKESMECLFVHESQYDRLKVRALL